MKNLSVGKKILAAFLVVIIMIGILLGMTVITSTTRNSDLQQVDEMSALLRDANNMLNSFNLARVEIRTLFTSIDAEDEYYLTVDYLEQCNVLLGEMELRSTELDGYLAEDIAALRGMFAQISAAIDAVADNDGNANESIAEIIASGTLMAESAAEVYDVVTELTLTLAENDPATSVDRVRNVIVPAKVLIDRVNEVRVVSRRLMLSQEIEAAADIRTAIDSMLEQAQVVRQSVTSDQARLATDKLIETTGTYRKAVDHTETLLKQSEVEIATARAIFLDLNNLVNNYVTTIAADVAELNAGVIRTSVVVMYMMIAISVVSAVFAFLVASYLGRIITRPLSIMKDAMLQAGQTGNLYFDAETKATIDHEAQAKDELGQSLSAFANFITHLESVAHILEQVADKDLTLDIQLLSPSDTMGLSLKSMLESLNSIFSEINSASAQVSTASSEIAMGAQGLAQGSTEQAATLQEISASVTEINAQMDRSGETVDGAAQGGKEINEWAMDGEEKMRHLTQSMQDINEASQAIGRVIKVIDDIAFQTNILALNAAVEAARAGAAGKGFAVVAEEVRTLATKSAEAAKETSTLINANLEKTELGMTYVNDTGASLTQIVTGIRENNDALRLIVDQIQGVRLATSEVSTAIDQVALVVQQNSATSEESAAASEQLNSQANLLRQMVSQFRLKGASGGFDFTARNLPEHTEYDDPVETEGFMKSKY